MIPGPPACTGDMDTRETLVAKQQEKLAALEAELAEHLANGNELYAHYVRDEIVIWSSPARLIHKSS